MDIVQARLVAINAVSRPQVISIDALPDSDFVLGRPNFFDGEDTIISRRHARFSINAPLNTERLTVSNLSNVNGLLVNFEPLLPFATTTIYDGDEIVHPFLSTSVFLSIFVIWGID
jgi:pSer/pThr/pTyr-binding forkhead associated (FHA) protein